MATTKKTTSTAKKPIKGEEVSLTSTAKKADTMKLSAADIKEIAAKTGESQTTVKSVLTDAVPQISTLLASRGGKASKKDTDSILDLVSGNAKTSKKSTTNILTAALPLILAYLGSNSGSSSSKPSGSSVLSLFTNLLGGGSSSDDDDEEDAKAKEKEKKEKDKKDKKEKDKKEKDKKEKEKEKEDDNSGLGLLTSLVGNYFSDDDDDDDDKKEDNGGSSILGVLGSLLTGK